MLEYHVQMIYHLMYVLIDRVLHQTILEDCQYWKMNLKYVLFESEFSFTLTGIDYWETISKEADLR